MQMIANGIRIDGPALLYHLFCQYTSTEESVICTYQVSLNNLLKNVLEMNLNVDKFCDYSAEILKTHCNTDGDDSHTSLKLYKALVSSKVNTFNPE
eukprot:4997562-Ditylum_brightwellii.AAC.1